MFDWSSHLMKSVRRQSFHLANKRVYERIHMEQLCCTQVRSYTEYCPVREYLHEREDDAVQLLDEGLLLLAVVARVPVEDVDPGDPEVLLGGLGGRAHHHAILYYLLQLSILGPDFMRSPGLVRDRLDVEVIMCSLLGSHTDSERKESDSATR